MADKGGSIVVQNKKVERLLSDSTTYERLNEDFLPLYKVELYDLVNEAFSKKVIITSKHHTFTTS